MADLKPKTTLEVVAAVVGALVAFVVVLPLIPLVLDFAVGLVRGVFDVIVPGGRTYSE